MTTINISEEKTKKCVKCGEIKLLSEYYKVDHKIPISVFNFECPQDIDFGKCWSLENLRPLEKSKNRAKRNTLEEPFQPSLMLRF
jgi:5-methylcytosine-specific restriction endonuclease McrA